MNIKSLNKLSPHVFPILFFLFLFFNLSPESYGKNQNPQFDKENDKISLWTGKTQLRGANIWQTRAYKGEFSYQIGQRSVGPEYSQNDFFQLAKMGANYVNISCPGLFTETPPFKMDKNAQTNLDTLLQKIEKADMFAVISFRTGPGRSEFTFVRDEVNDWFEKKVLNESIWTSAEKQEAWISMWQYTAKRYRNSSIVVGYDLMVEPNSNEVLGIDEPEIFYQKYKNKLPDWNQLYPKIIKAIRMKDLDTPVLVGGNGYSAVEWFKHLGHIKSSNIVYTIHQYAPYEYTHQPAKEHIKYPGKLDLNWDEKKDVFNKTWIEMFLSSVVSSGLSIAVNEFGVQRWVPGGDKFMNDQITIFEKHGWNHALWMWYPKNYPDDMNEFNFKFGPNPKNNSILKSSVLLEAIKANWGKNKLRPSTY